MVLRSIDPAVQMSLPRKSSIVDGSTVVITGGAGTLGQACVEAVLERFSPREIRICSRDESRLVEFQERIRTPLLRCVVADVRDRFSLGRVLEGADVVIHAAAMKHVNLCEENPFEAADINVNGTIHVIQAAVEAGVSLFLGISTDKAVSPLSLYGASKLICERLLAQAGRYDPAGKTRFGCVRLGNISGSSGSVVDVFRAQSRSGRIRITDARMTRFWVGRDEAARFVLNCLDRMRGGEVFVPKLPSVRILELAGVVAPGAKKEFVGARRGEKIHEVLITEDESVNAIEFADHYVVCPNGLGGGKADGGGLEAPSARRSERQFEYSSETNTSWLSGEALRRVIEGIRGDDLQNGAALGLTA